MVSHQKARKSGQFMHPMTSEARSAPGLKSEDNSAGLVKQNENKNTRKNAVHAGDRHGLGGPETRICELKGLASTGGRRD